MTATTRTTVPFLRRRIDCAAPGCNDTGKIGQPMCDRHHIASRRVLNAPVTIAAPRPGWRTDAACDGMDTDLWYPEDGLRPDDTTLAICGTCPVRDDCLLSAKASREPGWWGGVAPRRRSVLTRRTRTSRAA